MVVSHDLFPCQINTEYDSIDEGETIARTFADYWVVCRKSGHRSFFVVLNQKNANFAEINGKFGLLSIHVIAWYECLLSVVRIGGCIMRVSSWNMEMAEVFARVLVIHSSITVTTSPMITI